MAARLTGAGTMFVPSEDDADPAVAARQHAPKLSIVIPAYNVAPYLPALFDSLGFARRPEIEFIFVEDCSTDETAVVLERLIGNLAPAAARLIYQKANAGLGAARNTGLRAARGTYVWFVDSDDVVASAHLPALLDAMSDEPDIVMFDFFRLDDLDAPAGAARSTQNRRWRSVSPGRLLVRSDRVLAACLHDQILYAWSYCFRRELLSSGPFPEGVLYEDVACVPALLLRARTSRYVPQALVGYRRRRSGLTGTPTAKRDLDLAAAMAANLASLPAGGLSRSELRAFVAFWLQTLVWSGRRLAVENFFSDPRVCEAFDSCWRVYRRYAGRDHHGAVLGLPARRAFHRLLACAGTLSPTLLRALAGIGRQRTAGAPRRADHGGPSSAVSHG